MAVGVQKKRIVPAMIMSFKFQKVCTSSMGARQTQREHCGLASSIGEAYSLGGQQHAPETLGRLQFGRSRLGARRALRHRMRHDLVTRGTCMSLYHDYSLHQD